MVLPDVMKLYYALLNKPITCSTEVACEKFHSNDAYFVLLEQLSVYVAYVDYSAINECVL